MKKHILILLAVIIVGCNTTGNSNDNLDFPDIGIPAKNLNQHLKIDPPSEIHLSQGENCFVVIIENISDSIITVEPDLDVKIFQKTNSGWEAIQNGMNYTHWKWSVPMKGGDIPNIIPVDMCPILYDFNESREVRVVIIGTPENLPNVTNAISFVDVTILP